MTRRHFLKQILRLIFESAFGAWIIFSILEIIFPGMVIHYINFNWLLLGVVLLGLILTFK